MSDRETVEKDARPAHWTAKPWPENRYPTVDEWIDWFLAAPTDQQQAEAAMCIADAQRALRCLMLHPQPNSPIPPGSTDGTA